MCRRLGMAAWPATESKLITYCAYAHESIGLRPKTIGTYVAGLCFEHKIRGWEDPRGEGGLLGLVLDGCHRIDKENGVEDRLRLGIDARLLDKLIRSLDLSKFREARFAAFATLAYFGAFRPSELVMSESGSRLHWADYRVVDHESGVRYLEIRQYVSKTRQFGPSITIAVGATDGPTCPKALMDRYASHLRGRLGTSPVFAQEDGVSPYTYTQALVDVRFFLRRAGVKDVSSYSLHSFRIGMASEAGRRNLPDHLIKMLGRWNSDCFLRYIRADPVHLAATTRALALNT